MIPKGEEKKKFVKEKFAAVSHRYDFLNTLLSLYIDHYWRWITIKELKDYSSGPILDLCAGTLPLSAEIIRQCKREVICLDFCFDMLAQGIKNYKDTPKGKYMSPVCGDGERLPLKDDQCWGVTVAFGIRNLSKPEQGLKEMFRILKPGGKAVILEFSRPSNPIFAPIYRFYLHKFLPFLAGMISGDKEAYSYLADSIQAFYDPPVLAGLMRDSGFRDVKFRPLTFGIVTVYSGIK